MPVASREIGFEANSYDFLKGTSPVAGKPKPQEASLFLKELQYTAMHILAFEAYAIEDKIQLNCDVDESKHFQNNYW